MNTTTTTDQDKAFEALANQMLDFAAEGIKRYGSPEAFLAKLTAYNAQR